MDRYEGGAGPVKKTLMGIPLKSVRPVFSLLVLAAALAWIVFSNFFMGQTDRGLSPVEAGSPAPDFQLTTLDGQTVNLGDFRGRPLILNFFASWCDPCREEAPVVREMAARSGAGYALLGIAIQDKRGPLEQFMQNEGLTMPVALDTDGKVSRAYWVVGPPATFFIDADGILRHLVAGPLTPARVEEGLDKLAAAGRTSDGDSPEAGFWLGLALALGAGLLSFFSPCVLPLLPAFLGYMTGMSAEELRQGGKTAGLHRRVLGSTIAFALGLAAAFTILGASASLFGGWLVVHRSLIAQIGGLLVLVFGFHMLGFLRIPLLYREFRPGLDALPPGNQRGTLGAAALMGAAFGIGWTPCIGPMLGSILLLASQEDTVWQGMLLLAVYGFGLGIPFVLTGLATNRVLGMTASMKRHLPHVEKAAGVLLTGMGILLVLDKMNAVALWFSRVL